MSSYIDLSKISYRQLVRAIKTDTLKKLLKFPQRYLDPQNVRDKGIKVTIMANTLVDTEEQPPIGLVNVALATVDILSPYSMPGDFTATSKDKEGKEQIGYMITYGAGSVDVSANGKNYILKEGAKAIIEIPLPKHLEGSNSIPKTIPFLKYDKEKGIWKEVEGIKGTFDEKTQVYTATTDTFSNFNMDLVKRNPACLAIDGTGIKKDYILEVHFEYPLGTGPRSKQKFPNANEIYALYNLAPDIPYTLIALKTDPTNNIEIDRKTCTPDPQHPPPPPAEPDPGNPTSPTFPACHHQDCDKPVPLSAAKPDPPTGLTLTAGINRIDCAFIDIECYGNAFGSEEGYIINVDELDDAGNIVRSFERSIKYPATTDHIDGLTPDTKYSIQIQQYDEYAAEYSDPYPPETITTPYVIFTIINHICDHEITRVGFNDEAIDRPLPSGGFIHGTRQEYHVCHIPDSIQVTTESRFNTDSHSFDIRGNADGTIYIGELVKILPYKANDWVTNDIVPTRRILVFENDSQRSFTYYNDQGVVLDTGTYEETDQECNSGISFIISFKLYFDSDDLADPDGVDGTYNSSTNTLIIPNFPKVGAPSAHATFQ